jgi:hypothetical protein
MGFTEKVFQGIGAVLFVVLFPITVPIYMCYEHTDTVEEPQPVQPQPQPQVQYKNGKPYPIQMPTPTPNELASLGMSS